MKVEGKGALEKIILDKKNMVVLTLSASVVGIEKDRILKGEEGIEGQVGMALNINRKQVKISVDSENFAVLLDVPNLIFVVDIDNEVKEGEVNLIQIQVAQDEKNKVSVEEVPSKDFILAEDVEGHLKLNLQEGFQNNTFLL